MRYAQRENRTATGINTATRRLGAGAIVVVAVVWTVYNVRAVLPTLTREHTAPEVTVHDWRSLAVGGQRLGPVDAPLVAIVFSDYKCGACATMDSILNAFRRAHPAQVALVYRNFPLGVHPEAMMAARAAICAGAQGQFEEVSRVMFKRASVLGQVSWSRVGREVGVNHLDEFARCLASPASLAAVEADMRAARTVGFSVVPLILINGDVFNGVPWDFRDILESHLRAVSEIAK